MDLRKLAVFCKVYELKSFSRAGEETFLSQPTVSSHIKYLENLLEVRLFDRTGREVVPTRAADILYRYAVRMTRLRDEAIQSLMEYHGRIEGELVVGASTIPAAYLLPRVFGAFRQRFPQVKLQMHVYDTRAVYQRILEGRLEVGMLGAQVPDRNIEYHPFLEDQLILVGLPDHVRNRSLPLTPRDLLHLPFLMREPGSGTRMAVLNVLNAAGINPSDLNVVAEFGSTEAIRQGIKAGLGVSIISDRAVQEDLASGPLQTIPLAGLPVQRRFYLAVHRNRTHSPVCKAFLAFCGEGGRSALTTQ